MSENHATPRPTPKPLCAIFEPLLPLLRSDGLTVEDRTALEEHLADCAWCQNQLATLDVVDAALRRHYASVPAATAGSGLRARVRPSLSLEDIMKADQEETTTAAAPHGPPTPIRQLTPVQRRLTALAPSPRCSCWRCWPPRSSATSARVAQGQQSSRLPQEGWMRKARRT